MKNLVILSALALTAVLSACGGSGGGTSTGGGTTPNPSTGWGDPSTITPVQLRGCPLASYKQVGALPTAVGTCLQGTYNGYTDSTKSQKCKLTIAGDGTMTYTNATMTKTIAFNPSASYTYDATMTNGKYYIDFSISPVDSDFRSNGISINYNELLDNSLPNIYINAYDGNKSGGCITKL